MHMMLIVNTTNNDTNEMTYGEAVEFFGSIEELDRVMNGEVEGWGADDLGEVDYALVDGIVNEAFSENDFGYGGSEWLEGGEW